MGEENRVLTVVTSNGGIDSSCVWQEVRAGCHPEPKAKDLLRCSRRKDNACPSDQQSRFLPFGKLRVGMTHRGKGLALQGVENREDKGAGMEFSSARQIKLVDARKAIPTQDGKPFALLFEHGSLQVEVFSPKKVDTQKPHSRDELYVVVSGTGWFFVEGQRLRFSAGDALFVAANEVHRFEDFSDDFLVWVVFYGPEGGERGESRAPAGGERL
jgi:mannose-6-phosphate isomerase-like protein (cupin superfamily)